MKLELADYTTDTSDLIVTIDKIKVATTEYVKVLATLTNKHNGIFYQTDEFTLKFAEIKRWRKCD